MKITKKCIKSYKSVQDYSMELHSLELHLVELYSAELCSVEPCSVELRSNSNLHSGNTLFCLKKVIKKGIVGMGV